MSSKQKDILYLQFKKKNKAVKFFSVVMLILVSVDRLGQAGRAKSD